jgi:hypothetical protein
MTCMVEEVPDGGKPFLVFDKGNHLGKRKAECKAGSQKAWGGGTTRHAHATIPVPAGRAIRASRVNRRAQDQHQNGDER